MQGWRRHGHKTVKERGTNDLTFFRARDTRAWTDSTSRSAPLVCAFEGVAPPGRFSVQELLPGRSASKTKNGVMNREMSSTVGRNRPTEMGGRYSEEWVR